jgi:hypothetical protein
MADDRKDLDIEKEEKAAPVRRRDAQMDAIVKAVSKSPRFSHEIASQAFCAAVAKAKRAEGALPGSAEGDEKEKRKRP